MTLQASADAVMVVVSSAALIRAAVLRYRGVG